MMPLLDKAKVAGFSPQYVRQRVLPFWWDDEIARSPAGLAQAAALVARHTGLDFESLRDRRPGWPKVCFSRRCFGRRIR